MLYVHVTFPHLLVLYLSAGDLIGFSLLIFLQLLGILHLLPLCLIKVALHKHTYTEGKALFVYVHTDVTTTKQNKASENSLGIMFFILPTAKTTKTRFHFANGQTA